MAVTMQAHIQPDGMAPLLQALEEHAADEAPAEPASKAARLQAEGGLDDDLLGEASPCTPAEPVSSATSSSATSSSAAASTAPPVPPKYDPPQNAYIPAPPGKPPLAAAVVQRFEVGQSVLIFWASWFAGRAEPKGHYKQKERPTWYSGEIINPGKYVKDLPYAGELYTGMAYQAH